MQDLKHLTRKKSGFLSGGAPANRRLPPPAQPTPQSACSGSIRRVMVPVAVIVLIVLILGGGALLATRYASSMAAWTRALFASQARSPRPAEAARPPVSIFENACSLLSAASLANGKVQAITTAGDRLEYSINNGLQQRIREYFAGYQVPYGAFVAIEPATGRILAMTAYSAVDPSWSGSAVFELYPMASLFKIVTASAALEAGKITPDTVIEFRGKATSESPRYWPASPRGRNNKMDVTYAMGKSINPVYGRLACDIAGKEAIMERVRRFGFNQAILPGVPIRVSQAGEPVSDRDLMLMGAGLDHDVKVSPLHAAMIMASIANGGRMMVPSLTDRVLDGGGVEKESHQPRELTRLVSPATSSALTRMLSTTVTTGTSRKAFHDRRGRPVLGALDIAAKTGSINGDSPRGHYSWFAAYAPAQAPRIALVALVINQEKWKIKASQVGEQALEEFFRN